MEFVDYLAFIQVSIAFNFTSAYLKDSNEDDYIRKLFRVLWDWDKIETDFKLIKEQEGFVDNYKPVLSAGVDDADYRKRLRTFYLLKNNWNIVNQKMLYKYSSLVSKDHYTFFNNVCVLLALYGFFQLFMLPDVCKQGHELLHNSYLFVTEIVMFTLCLLLFIEIIQKVEFVSKFLKLDFIYHLPLLFSVFLFILIGILGFLFALSLEQGWRGPWILEFCESDLIYMSIFLPYASFIIYFFLNVWNFCCESWNLSVKIPKLKKIRKQLQVNVLFPALTVI